MREVLRFLLDPEWEPPSAKRDAKDAERRAERARVREKFGTPRILESVRDYVLGLLIVAIIIGLGILLIVLGEAGFNLLAYTAAGIFLLAWGVWKLIRKLPR